MKMSRRKRDASNGNNRWARDVDSPNPSPSYRGHVDASAVSSHPATIPVNKWAAPTISYAGCLPTPGASSQSTQDLAFKYVQEMFGDKVDAEVIYMVLGECNWEGNLRSSKMYAILIIF